MRKKTHNEAMRKRAARRQRVHRSLDRSERPQLMVHRSSKHIYAQLRDPATRQIITAVSTRSPSLRAELQSTSNVEAARRVGRAIAALASERRIEKVVFNRNGFLYHGRVKALAEAAREAGLQF